MVDERLHDRIEKYLLGELSSEERARLEEEMANDPEVREQMEIQKLALMGIKEYAASDMREKFRQWDRELDEKFLAFPTPGDRSARFRFLAWAAALLLFLLATLTIMYIQQTKKVRKNEEWKEREMAVRDSLILALKTGILEKQAELNSIRSDHPDSLFLRELRLLREEVSRMEQKVRELEKLRLLRNKQLALALAPEPESSIPLTRGESEGMHPLLDAAFTAYDSARFEDAVNLLQNIPPSDTLLRPGVLQVLPFALFYSGRFKGAAATFTELMNTGRYEKKRAEGYLMLCHLALDQSMEARKILSSIQKDAAHPFYQQALKLKPVLDMESF